jgi:hypothetical protein
VILQVDASTASAGDFFSTNRLLVPDYQRKYSWGAKTQIAEFWRDLSGAIDHTDYFLGLVILADSPERREVVDGQQRLVTMTILANALRLSAQRLGRRLVAESLRADFLFSMDYETEKQVCRIRLTDRTDRENLEELLTLQSGDELQLRTESAIHGAHEVLAKWLDADLASHENPALRVGQWAQFLTKRVSFAVFTHPDRSAAFRVYEVINTRGKILTPTELIKSFLIGSSDGSNRGETHARWDAIEEQLDGVGAIDQLTTFVRHSITLDHGYVIPRDLYQVVSANYRGVDGVEQLLDRLEQRLPIYMQMIDPSSDVETSETRTRVFALADALSMSRFRPIMLAASLLPDSDDLLSDILRVAVPGVLTGDFGTGSIEAQFARAARRLHNGADWQTELAKLGELRPSREVFTLRLARNVNKSIAQVVRSAYLQKNEIPSLQGFPHQVRPRNGENWLEFDSDQYREFGGFLGNWVLTGAARRPQNSRTPSGVVERILPYLVDDEDLRDTDLIHWTSEVVLDKTRRAIDHVSELWYGHR